MPKAPPAPILLNGIGAPITSSDLLDRCVVADLPRLEEDDYVSEEELWSRFRAAHPAALGAILTGVARALADGASTATPPGRMADAAKWITAAAPAFSWPRAGRGSFALAYATNRRDADTTAVETSAVGPHLLAIADRGFDGSASELLARLNEAATEEETRAREWPKTAAAAGQLLARLAPNLLRMGYGVEHRTGAKGRRTWTLTPPRARQE